MKLKVKKEVEAVWLKLEVAVRYDDEDIPYDFPFRNGNSWAVTIEIDKGRIMSWPKGYKYDLHMKVCDQGNYYLLDDNDEELASIEDDYVPNDLIPGSYGDYIELNINEDGYITNWPKNPSLSSFEDHD